MGLGSAEQLSCKSRPWQIAHLQPDRSAVMPPATNCSADAEQPSKSLHSAAPEEHLCTKVGAQAAERQVVGARQGCQDQLPTQALHNGSIALQLLR